MMKLVNVLLKLKISIEGLNEPNTILHWCLFVLRRIDHCFKFLRWRGFHPSFAASSLRGVILILFKWSHWVFQNLFRKMTFTFSRKFWCIPHGLDPTHLTYIVYPKCTAKVDVFKEVDGDEEAPVCCCVSYAYLRMEPRPQKYVATIMHDWLLQSAE